jgi:hypothetical protein
MNFTDARDYLGVNNITKSESRVDGGGAAEASERGV